MNVYQWVLIGYFLFSLVGTWYLVDRPRPRLSAGMALFSTVLIGILIWLVTQA